MKAVALKGPKNTFSRKQAHQQEACRCSSLVGRGIFRIHSVNGTHLTAILGECFWVSLKELYVVPGFFIIIVIIIIC